MKHDFVDEDAAAERGEGTECSGESNEPGENIHDDTIGFALAEDSSPAAHQSSE